MCIIIRFYMCIHQRCTCSVLIGWHIHIIMHVSLNSYHVCTLFLAPLLVTNSWLLLCILAPVSNQSKTIINVIFGPPSTSVTRSGETRYIHVYVRRRKELIHEQFRPRSWSVLCNCLNWTMTTRSRSFFFTVQVLYSTKV